tara:strand:+ start:100 stop:969 length:870 start_codon:yes stop_codon:yes gene_type:complete
MKTVNSLSGGKTSSYIAANYPADYNIFSLVRTNDKNCMFPDKKIRQEVSDRIGTEFVGTLEMDTIIYTMLDLEQYIGRKIDWVTGVTFDELINNKNGKTYLPQANFRRCSSDLKVVPIANFWYNNIKEPVEMRIGFRANEKRRANNMLAKTDQDGYQTEKIKIEKRKTKTDRWKDFKWRTLSFPLINDNIYKDNVEVFWKDKPVRFAYMNNCVGCFHRNPLLLKHMSLKEENKFDWFMKKENESIEHYNGRQWYIDKNQPSYEQIKNTLKQFDLFDDDFNECDSGYCGL